MRRNGHPIVAAGVVPVEEVTFVVTPLPQPRGESAWATPVRGSDQGQTRSSPRKPLPA